MRVLLVEDSDEVSCITVEYLQELQHEARAVADAEQALAHLSSERFDAVMTDVRLPGKSGIELAKELAVSHPHLPVIIVSGYGTANIEALLGGRPDNVLMLAKPYELSQLDVALQKAGSMAATAKAP